MRLHVDCVVATPAAVHYLIYGRILHVCIISNMKTAAVVVLVSVCATGEPLVEQQSGATCTALFCYKLYKAHHNTFKCDILFQAQARGSVFTSPEAAH